MRRLFVALSFEPSEEFLDALHSIKEELASERIKWVEVDNLHLTLKYIGEVQQFFI